MAMSLDKQQSFVEACEEEFNNRFTDKDPEFTKYMTTDNKKPPIIDPWYNKPRRPQFDWRQGKRQNHWERRNNDRYERSDRHGGKHHAYQRNSRPY